ncbi:MAG: hypothetical protein AAF224_08635 [Pseudomonadota bacterium]
MPHLSYRQALLRPLTGVVSAALASFGAASAQTVASAACAPDDIDCRVEAAKARMLERPAGLRPGGDAEATVYGSNDQRLEKTAAVDGPYAPQNVRQKPVRGADKKSERNSNAARLGGAGQNNRASRRKSKSVYDGFGHAVYARGGALLSGHVTNGDYDALGFTTAIGYRKRFGGPGRSTWWFQPEILYFRDRFVDDVASIDVATTFSGIAGLVSLRWAYDAGFIMPFASVGIGPTYLKTVVDDTFSVTRIGEYAVGYSGTAGFETALTDTLSIETAYRYIGTVREQAFGYHTAEIGVNYKF